MSKPAAATLLETSDARQRPNSPRRAAAFEVIHRRRKRSLCADIAAEARIFPSARHVDGKTGKAILEQDIVVGAPIFFPAVDTTPVHHHRRSIHSLGHLQIADDLLSF